MSETDWTTENEIEFIKGLGKHKWTGRKSDWQVLRRQTETRLDLLIRYREAYDRRLVWGEIDPTAVLEAVELEIVNEARKPSNVSAKN